MNGRSKRHDGLLSQAKALAVAAAEIIGTGESEWKLGP